MTRPTSAAASSAKTARRVGFEVLARKLSGVEPGPPRLGARVCRRRLDEGDALEHEGDGEHGIRPEVRRLRLLVAEGRDAVPDRHDRAGAEQPEGREHRPDVGLAPVAEGVRPASRGFAARRSAMSRKTSLPASAHECAASATIEADPVNDRGDRLRDSNRGRWLRVR